MIGRTAGVLGLALAAVSGCGVGSDPTLSMKDETCGIPGLVAVPRAEVDGPGSCGIPEPVVVTRVSSWMVAFA